jgi:glycine/D-amino acid oxidase-like deaminating enzyme
MGSELSNRDGAGMRFLILGGGVIGTSIAYHLAARGAEVVVLERSAIACAASG